MLAFVGIGLSALALILNIVGLAIPDWLVADGVKIGLWKGCFQDQCADIPSESLSSSYKATRAMEIIGTLVLTSALACAIIKQFIMKDQKILPKISGACAILSGIFMIVGCVIFATVVKDDVSSSADMDLNAGFALCIVAGVLAIVAAVLIFIGFKDE